MQRFLCWALAIFLSPLSAFAETQDPPEGPLVRVLTSSFVMQGKFRAMEPFAAAEGVRIDSVDVQAGDGGPEAWVEGADLILLDVPRRNDRDLVEAALGAHLDRAAARLTIGGGGPPDWQGLPPEDAARLAGYYAAGGAENLRHFFRHLALWSRDASRAGLPAPVATLEAGIYHPDAPRVFASVSDYLGWHGARGGEVSGTVGFVIPAGMVTSMQTGVIDGLIRDAEAVGLRPVAFWAPAEDMAGLLRAAGADALVVQTHLQNGPALAETFLDLDIPVIQTTGFRAGTPEEFRRAPSGVAPGSAAIFLASAEVWGASDPIVLTAVRGGEEVLIPEQATALAWKLRAIARLRHTPEAEKRLAMLFWNYPAGEKNFAASNLNLPRSIETITHALHDAGYTVAPLSEAETIEGLQALLAGIWRSTPLEDLLARDLAVALPVAAYLEWLDGIPADRRRELLREGDPARHWAVREVAGAPAFVIPRLARGNLVILPQMPRDPAGGHAHYHDTAAAPDHLYMAAYLWLRRDFGADAIIHLGTHGTQEWLAGKDRGLWAGDYPWLAVGDVPVFYPYLQDNVSEAIQARRRGRAVIVSHQTPPFAPAGLQEDLRDIHHLVHEYDQLAEGPVRDASAAQIRAAARASGIAADMGWDEAGAEADFSGFLDALHDHLHHLAQSAVPLGLHRFGHAPDPEHRLVTVMQQLGAPFLDRFSEDGEPFSDDPALIGQSAPVVQLRRWLREGEPAATPELATLRDRAAALDAALADPGEVEALLAGLAGRLVPPGAGGDPIRNPEVRAGRNLYAFEANRIPAEAAYVAGGEALGQLLAAYASDHDGALPGKLAFSLWASEAISHLGVTEAQILHALGLRPMRDAGGRLTALDIIPAEELGRPRIDVVISATSVYRDQFDSFMRLLAGAIDRLADLDEPGNAVAENSRRIAAGLQAAGSAPDAAASLARHRIFSNAPGGYGSGVGHVALDSTGWEDEAIPAETFLDGTRFAYGAGDWGVAAEGTNLFAEQLRGTDAAIMSRSSNLHGVLGSDHPFEFLGGLALAIRHLDGESPDLYISDLRRGAPRTAPLANFLSDELRLRNLSPQWISAMQEEGYSGTLSVLNGVNNLFGWQVMDPGSVRADQWQSMFDTYVTDSLDLGINDWFDAHNPTAQAQLIARMAEAIRKGYWNAAPETRGQMAARWEQLISDPDVQVGEAVTQEFLAAMTAGYGLGAAPPATGAAPEAAQATDTAPQQVQGRVLEPVGAEPASAAASTAALYGLAAILALTGLGTLLQIRANRAPRTGDLTA